MMDLIAVRLRFTFILYLYWTAYSVYLMTIRLIVILVLALYLTSDQCHGFAEEGLRELCRKLSNTDPAKNGSSTGPSESATFSCSDCTPNTSNVHVCMHCYKTEENEAFSCRSCKIESKAKPFICEECKANSAHDASQESDTGSFTHSHIWWLLNDRKA